MIAVDTNILVYAHRTGQPKHAAAREALRELSEGGAWAIPVFVLAEFLRVATHPRTLTPPSEERDAVAALDDLIGSPGVRILSPGGRFWPLMRETVLAAGVRGNVIHDAAIATVCREHGVTEILTHDRDFERFAGITVRRLDD